MPLSTSVLVLASVISLIVGCLLGRLSQRGRIAAQQESLDQTFAENKRLQSEAIAASTMAASNAAKARSDQERAERLEDERESLTAKKDAAEIIAARAQTQLEEERKQAARVKADTTALANQFEVLAGKIMKDQSDTFTIQNETNLGSLLAPLKTQLSDFRRKIEEVQTQNVAQNSELGVHLTQLKNMNAQLSQEASNLARALRASPAAAGRLGDDFLLRVLETAGLQEGINYRRQQTLKSETGASFRPDYILDLPGDRHIVIDAKMSLKDYDDYRNAEDEKSRESSLTEHLKSVRSHIVQLSAKNYQVLHGLNSLDFVVMFMPVEPAFHLAIAKDIDLWDEALSRNVLLVSPSTLLFVVRTVAHLWKQEQQMQNVREIVERGSALYDKFVGFVDDIRKVGSSLDQAQGAYGDALGKLSTGPGNLVRQVEMLRVLGVTPRGKKGRLPPDLVAAAMQEGLFALAAEAEAEASAEDDV